MKRLCNSPRFEKVESLLAFVLSEVISRSLGGTQGPTIGPRATEGPSEDDRKRPLQRMPTKERTLDEEEKTLVFGRGDSLGTCCLWRRI